MPSRPTARLLLAAVALTASAALWTGSTETALAVQSQSSATSMSDVYDGKTLPSREVDLAFDDLGKVVDVQVERGDRVEPGQLLMRQDDRAEQARMEELKLQADVTSRVELARKKLALAEVQLKRAQDQRSKGAGSAEEVEEAQLNRDVAEVEITEEIRQGKIAETRVAQLQVVLDKKRLISPIEGVVSEVEAFVGEIFGPQSEPALKVVQIDPLDVEVATYSFDPRHGLEVGDTVSVRYTGETQWRDAKIKFLGPAGPGDAFDTQKLILTMPNPEGHPAGLNVEVKLSDE